MDFVKLSEQRFTAKKFDVNKKIPRDDVEKLKTILQLSPSSVNSQPWVFLWGTSDNSKKRVRPAIADFNWNRIDTCSDFIVIAVRKGLDDKFQHTLLDQEIKDGRIANEEIAKECFESRKFFIDLRERTGQTLNWETKQAYIAMTALLYGAASLGIDSTPIEGFDEDKMDKLLNLDNYGVHSVLVVTLGYDAEDDHNRTRPKSRLEQSKIFFDLDKFTRLEHAAESTKPEGLGLGLSIVREIADMHSASLHFERLAKGGVRAELMIDRLATKDPEKKKSMNKEHTLIRLVDDDESLLFSTKILLEVLGWKVAAYNSPAEFLVRDNLSIPGCAVLDVRMPQMTGLEVQETLIERGFAHFPLIFLSGHGDIQMAVNAMSKGALTFLEKPVDPERLNQEVTKAVELGIRRAEEVNELNALKRRYRQLTNREKEVLSLVAEGLTNKEIADRLELSVPTIKMHRSRASEKLAMDSVAEITRALILLNEASAK